MGGTEVTYTATSTTAVVNGGSVDRGSSRIVGTAFNCWYNCAWIDCLI